MHDPRFNPTQETYFCAVFAPCTHSLTHSPTHSLIHIHTHFGSFIHRIDDQFFRQTHHDEVEAVFRQKNSKYSDEILPADFELDGHMMEDLLSSRELQKDLNMARKNPMAYCADRCLETGNCDVFESMYVCVCGKLIVLNRPVLWNNKRNNRFDLF